MWMNNDQSYLTWAARMIPIEMQKFGGVNGAKQYFDYKSSVSFLKYFKYLLVLHRKKYLGMK